MNANLPRPRAPGAEAGGGPAWDEPESRMAASAQPGGRPRAGIGWLVVMLVFLLVAATPFVITAIVMLNR